MKIIVSPSKTKKIKKFLELKDKKNIFSDKTGEIIKVLSRFSIEEIERKFKLKKEQAQKLLNFYREYEKYEEGHSILSYSGVAFKSMNIDDFDKSDMEFLEKHIIILSALYGVLTPLTPIKEYRLDMVNSILEDMSLYEFWGEYINNYLFTKNKKEIIINLASKEYSKIIKSENIYNIEFYDNINGKLKQISTNSKKMRGYTLNYIVKNKITEVESLKNINLNGYIYDNEVSTDKNYIFIKKN